MSSIHSCTAGGTDGASGYGSFRDSLRAPVHRWFTYPAGYSHRLVESKIRQYGLDGRRRIADPFVGTGTTSVAAKAVGVNSVGVEAHPFVCWVAQTKLGAEADAGGLADDARQVARAARRLYEDGLSCAGVWPELVYKCFDEDNLRRLYALRTAVQDGETSEERRDLLKLALTATLRVVTSAGSGWPYIAPSKYAERTARRDAFGEFEKRCGLMVDDIVAARVWRAPDAEHRLVNGDARRLAEYAEPGSVDLILTSPPYLNNYDYADRTRLETYFWGMYSSWGEITRQVRDRLIIAATTQIRRTEMDGARHCPGIRRASPEVHSELMEAIGRLSELRTVKRGKKAYDLMVAGYFEDMLPVIEGAYAVLKAGQPFVLVLGDSAPYGVHIRTDELIGELAVAVGFSGYDVEVIRARGGKWAGNSQRHKTPLRESIVTITK